MVRDRKEELQLECRLNLLKCSQEWEEVNDHQVKDKVHHQILLLCSEQWAEVHDHQVKDKLHQILLLCSEHWVVVKLDNVQQELDQDLLVLKDNPLLTFKILCQMLTNS